MADQFVAEIRAFPFNFPPRGWALCDGQLMAISQNTALFSLLGTFYGGDGKSTFGLPNLQGRVALHRSQNGQYQLGQISGVEQVTITQTTMPMHNHSLLGTTTLGDKRVPNSTLAASSVNTNYYYSPPTNPVQLNMASIGPAGGNVAHENMQPFLVMNYCIALVGLFPSRN